MTPCHLVVSLPPVLVPPVSLAWHQFRFVPPAPFPAAPLYVLPPPPEDCVYLLWVLFPFLHVAWFLEPSALSRGLRREAKTRSFLEVWGAGKLSEGACLPPPLGGLTNNGVTTSCVSF